MTCVTALRRSDLHSYVCIHTPRQLGKVVRTMVVAISGERDGPRKPNVTLRCQSSETRAATDDAQRPSVYETTMACVVLVFRRVSCAAATLLPATWTHLTTVGHGRFVAHETPAFSSVGRHVRQPGNYDTVYNTRARAHTYPLGLPVRDVEPMATSPRRLVSRTRPPRSFRPRHAPFCSCHIADDSPPRTYRDGRACSPSRRSGRMGLRLSEREGRTYKMRKSRRRFAAPRVFLVPLAG